jgi:hypothetical protein
MKDYNVFDKVHFINIENKESIIICIIFFSHAIAKYTIMEDLPAQNKARYEKNNIILCIQIIY